MILKRPETWFPELVRQARTKQGLSQWNFAIKHGINISTVRDWEQGLSLPAFEMLSVLIRALGEDADELLEKLGWPVEAI